MFLKAVILEAVIIPVLVGQKPYFGGFCCGKKRDKQVPGAYSESNIYIYI